MWNFVKSLRQVEKHSTNVGPILQGNVLFSHGKCSKSDSEKKFCCVMKTKFGTNDASCVVCPKKCRCDEHFDAPYKWECYQVEEVRTYEDLKARYVTATCMSGKVEKEAIIVSLREGIEVC